MSKKLIYEGKKIKLEVHDVDIGGKIIKKEKIVHPGSVVIVALTDDCDMLFVRNKRFAVGEELFELPAGTIEKDETPLECAKRELLEETGYIAQKFKQLGDFYTSPGFLDEKIYMFFAFKLTKERPALLQDDEDLVLELVPDRDVFEMIRKGQIKDGKSITTILFHEQFCPMSEYYQSNFVWD